MSPLEPFALGLAAVRRAFGEWRAPPGGRGWLLLAAVLAAGVGALAFSAHPALSWLMAPLLERSGLDGVLRYPGHFEHLPRLTRRMIAVASIACAPVLASRTMMVAAARWSGAPGPSAASLLKLALPSLLVSLPMLALVGVLHAALSLLEGVRLSSLTRAALPLTASALTLMLHASWGWMLPRVVLGGQSVVAAWREWGRQFARGFLPALVPFGAAALMQLPAERLLDSAHSFVERGQPEMVVTCAILRVIAMAASGWFVAVCMALLHSAVPMGEDR